MNSTEQRTPVLDVEKLRSPTVREGGATVSFSLAPAEVMGVVGPGNSGKSALLACLGGVLAPAAGHVRILAQPPKGAARSLVGYVSSLPGVYEEFTCREYLEFFGEAFEVDEHYRPYLVMETLKLVGLEGYQGKMVRELNYGQRRFLGIGRAVVHHPAVLVVDDCLERLDRSERSQIVDILMKVRDLGLALVLSSSSLSELSSLCSHLCILVSDRVLACGPVKNLLPKIVDLKMMQVQFEAGFRTAVRLLEKYPNVFHLSVSTHTFNLVRFLFDGDEDAFRGLLARLEAEGCSIVSYAEDHRFLGKVPVSSGFRGLRAP